MKTRLVRSLILLLALGVVATFTGGCEYYDVHGHNGDHHGRDWDRGHDRDWDKNNHNGKNHNDNGHDNHH